MESQSDSTQTVSSLKLPMLKTGDYDLWSMRMEQYLTHTDYALWEVIVNGDAPAVASASTEGPIPPKTAEQKIARKNELKAKSTLLLAIPDEHLLKFHGIKDAKSLWEAIKTRFGGNKESKKMQKTILKQQYENFTASRSEGLDKIYDRFQKLISQLEIQGEVISQEDANLKLLRSLPSAWNNIALIMRNKPDLDELSMDDLYNNLKVYEAEIKSQSSSNSNSQNVAFVSSENTSSTNEAVNTALDVSTASTQGQASSSTYADDVMFSFFVNQSKSPLLDNEDMEQIDSDDLEEMDLKWQVAMLTMRIKRFIKKTRRNLNLNGKEVVGLDMTKVECYNCHRKCHFARDCRALRNQGNRNGDNARRVVPVETSANALVVQDGIGGYDWSFQNEDGPTNFALMAYTSQSSSSSDNEVHTCSKNCLKSFEALQKQYDQQREALSKSSLEIIGYQIGLESLEARIVVHEKNEASYEESIAFLRLEKFKQPEFEGYGVKVFNCDEDETVVLESLNVQKPKQADQPRKVDPINTVKGKRMTCAIEEQRINVVKPTTYCAWKPKIKMINHVYMNTGSCICKQFNYVDPTGYIKSCIVGFNEDFDENFEDRMDGLLVVLNSPFFTVNSWLIQDQTVLALAIPGQTATGKESSNPFMAGSLPKTINSNNVDEESQKIGRQAQVMISDAEEYLISEDPVKQGRMEETENA
ncbi:ribonuclease H-like domain-containing protein [Tanacetum coccineum]